MEVSCKQCQAKYQFEAAAIPPQGYDAQCTHCGAVFFVAPEQAAEALLSVSCQHCGAVYQFPASAVPPGGYDAQCTQCQQVFFVGTAAPPAEIPAPAVVAAAPAGPLPSVIPQPAPVVPPPEQPTVLAMPKEPTPTPAPVPLGRPKAGEPSASPAVAAPQIGSPPGSSAAAAPQVGWSPAGPTEAQADDLVAMAAELGEPLAPPDGANIEEDFEKILARKRKRRRAVLAVLGVVAGYLLITYLALPRVFDLTVGRFVGIKLTVHPQAIAPTEKAALLLLDDTEAAYQAAEGELLAALALDPDYAEAIAWFGLVNILRGEDIRARGRAAHRLAADAIAELRALDELPPAERPSDFAARVEALRQTAKANSDQSSAHFERGSKVVREGFARLRAGVEKNDRVPLLVEAAGIYYAMDSDSVKRAEELFNHAVRLQLGEHGKFDLKTPPDAWLPFLRGMILALDRNKQDEAAAAFAAAAAKEPRLVRAVWEQAKIAERQGNLGHAQALARAVIAKVPGHEKAAALLAVPAPATPVVAPPTADEAQGKAKKRKAKKKR